MTKIFVDVLPSKCRECDFKKTKNRTKLSHRCTITNRRIFIDIDKRPEWCPLVELK